MKPALLLAALLVLPATALAQAYKCTDATGKTVYQQAPCTSPNADRVRLFYESSPDDLAASRIPHELRVRFEALVGQNRVAIGMTAGMVRRSWGEPKKINSTILRGARSEQWVYSHEYVYLEDGIVSAMQTLR
jgi:hypothetical protein